MAKIRSSVKPLRFTEGSHSIAVHYSNRGEPFREGVEIAFDSDCKEVRPVWVLLNRSEVMELRDKLSEFLESQ
jgi:hypothetical protein